MPTRLTWNAKQFHHLLEFETDDDKNNSGNTKIRDQLHHYSKYTNSCKKQNTARESK